MADNLAVKDGAGASRTLAAKDVASVHVPRHIPVDESNVFLAPSTAAKQDAAAALFGAVNESAPGSDTASSGLNGRLQRIAQRLTSLIALVPSALGQGTMAQSMRVVIASDQTGLILPSGTSRSSSITTGGTAQQLAPSNSSRTALRGQNISSGDLWIDETGGTATADTAGSFRVPAGATFSVSTNRAISIVGATTGQKFTATEI